MIHGIGVDLATISRITGVHDRFGARFAKRILNTREWSQYESHHCPALFLAKRFAIKEAAVKALGTGERNGVLLCDFYVEHNELGRPALKASGEAEKLCRQFNIVRMHVSLSDEVDTVAAYVVLESS